MKIFTNEKINTGRQREADLLRGFTAINMLVCHVGLYLGSSANMGLWTFCDITGSEFAAPVFMALMGMGIIYSRHQAPADLLKRGLRIFIGGYALNFARSLLPLFILGPVDEWASVGAFFVVDILQFAGLSFMFIALLMRLKLPNMAILAVSICMVIVDQFLMLPDSFPWDRQLLIWITDLFVPVSGWSCFPFLTWFFFPAFGLVFGEMLIHCRDRKKLYTLLLPAGLAGVLYVYYTFFRLYPDYTSYYFGGNFYYMGLKNVLLTALFVCFAMAFWFFAEAFLPDFVKRFLGFLSRNLNTFYIISWLIIGSLMHVWAIFEINLSAWLTIALMVLIISACAVLTKLWLLVKNKVSAKSA